jgi:hypothetical protein
MIEPVRRDTFGVVVLALGAVLVGLGDVALWFLHPAAGAGLTIALGFVLVAIGARVLMRPPR